MSAAHQATALEAWVAGVLAGTTERIWPQHRLEVDMDGDGVVTGSFSFIWLGSRVRITVEEIEP